MVMNPVVLMQLWLTPTTLAAKAKKSKKLSNTVILFDPSFNPDGLQRFAYWATRSKYEFNRRRKR